ncbi:acyltransferase family protein [Kocuria sediminis]|uniref:Acyltransferase family protein n=1 Tax=Kocuria sediminis TaxID=1038857 RepID=A0A6N8GJH5_9MICC|nr:acyltransferase family protein [Kocuria sediminis]
MQTTPPSKYRTTHLRSLTGLRFYAALLVVLYHFSVHFHPMAKTGLLVGFGYTGVGFFFILSGFVLAWSRRTQDAKGTFYWRRFARVWPLHALTTALAIPVILFTGGGILWPTLPFILTLTHAWIPPGEWRYAFNGPSWSLACEAFFYVLFPLAVGWISKQRRLLNVGAPVFAGMVLVGAVGATVLPERVLGYLFYTMPAYRFGEFIIGICLALAIQRGWRPRFTLSQALIGSALMYMALMAVALAIVGTTEAVPYVVANVWMLPGYAAIIAAAATGDVSGVQGHLRSRTVVRLGQWSFALYLVHELVIKLAIPFVDTLSFTGAMATSTAILIVSVALAGALYEYFERPVEKRLRHFRLAPGFSRS